METQTVISRQIPSSSPFPQDGLTRGSQLSTEAPPVRFSKGLDRLKFGFYVEFESFEIFDLLVELKQQAQDLHEPVLYSFGEGWNFLVHPNGRKGGYNFHLSHADVNIFLSTRKDYMRTPNVWVDIGSSSCWNPGYKVVIESLRTLVIKKWHGKVHKNSVSEVHLCVDAVGKDINTLELSCFDHWITRANKFDAYFDRGRFSGVTLKEVPVEATTGYIETGAMIARGDLILRVYDKVQEIESNRSKQSLFASVWGKEEFSDVPVTRVEFQLRKPILRQFRVKTLQELFQKFSSLWDYLTHDWARLACTDIDRRNRHQDRAVIQPFWQEIQAIDWQTKTSVMRKQPLSLKDPVQLVEQAFGCLLNVAIIKGCESSDPQEVLHYLYGVLQDHVQILDLQKDKHGGTALSRKFEQKFCEVWPYGEVCEVHGPNERDAEVGIVNSYLFDLSQYEIDSNIEANFA